MGITAKILGSGCPKRKKCNMFNSEGETCRYGPYQYCGKYRLLNQKIQEQKPAMLECSQ